MIQTQIRKDRDIMENTNNNNNNYNNSVILITFGFHFFAHHEAKTHKLYLLQKKRSFKLTFSRAWVNVFNLGFTG